MRDMRYGTNCALLKQVLSTPDSQGAPKKKKEKSDVVPTYLPTFFEFVLRFLGLILEHIFMVFLGSSCRETTKNAVKENRWEMTKGTSFFFSQLFGQKLLTWIFPKKYFYGVFELPLLRNAQKHHEQIIKNY
jgi:hypothetical protein